MANSRLINISLISAAFLSVLGVIFPELDLAFSEFFFVKGSGFIYKKNFLVYQIYKILPLLTKLFSGACVVYLVFIIICYRNFGRVIRSGAFFLFLTSALGPGLIINGGLKENFGRARPSQIEQFGGSKEFTPAFSFARPSQCESNCSFSSGHAAMGYYFSGLAYIVSLSYFTRVYAAGLIFGSLVGLSRIMMGGHFLSDVAASAFIVLFFNHLMFILWQTILRKSKK